MFVIIKSNVLGVAMLQIGSQWDYRLLLALNLSLHALVLG